MDFELKTLDLSAASNEKADALLVLVPEGLQAGPVRARSALARLLADALAAGALDPAKPGKALACWRPEGIAASRVILSPIGKGHARRVQQAVAAAVTSLRGTGVQRLVVWLPQATGRDLGNGADGGAALRAAMAAARDASYAYTATKPKAEPRELRRVVLGVGDAQALREDFRAAQATGLGVELARSLGDLPPNVATPTHLAQEARRLAKSGAVRCQVLGPREVEKLGMGSFLGVAQGSREPLRFIVLRYQGAPASQAPVVLVGKGITFDSGGISIKPAAEMDEMKFDMSGAASVLGTFRALAELKPRLNVVGLVPACENLPGGQAMKPGDVLTSMSGQTIEVLNTDAEGRLILCDALTYAKRFKPRAVIDIATLTGACVVALGAVRSGLFASDDTLASALQAAGEAALDPCWRMPLDDEYGEGLKSNFADMGNVAGRMAGAVTAAKFLQRFVGDMPWAHLDIAGTAWRGGAAKGSTGRPVGLLVRYLLDEAASQTSRSLPARPVKPASRSRAVAPRVRGRGD
ncbi:MAG: leucyl aminopeptidase [Ramlibacter sp.]|uniref:leucyl aminopeptidase n=1 Tax=Ramlibacter sp. TaxID=1917967 RepID=UPI00260FD48F|nr:leucyl aminopeptidase [Ramlibacter sp.]MDH4374708.1 leucyl aminopeptidase [Ramlibacter sp.]